VTFQEVLPSPILESGVDEEESFLSKLEDVVVPESRGEGVIPATEVPEDATLRDLKSKLQEMSRILAERRPLTDAFAVPVPGHTIPQSLELLSKSLSKLTDPVSSESSETTVEDYTTLIELLTTTIQTIQYELRRLERLGSSAERDELEKQLEELRTIVQGVESISRSPQLDGEVKAAILNILDVKNSELTLLSDRLTKSRNEDEKRKQEYTAVVSELEDAQENLFSLEQEILSSGENASLPMSSQLSKLDKLEERFQLLKSNYERVASEGYQLVNEQPAEEIIQSVDELNAKLVDTDNLILNERNRIIQIISLSEEYEQTLKEFSQVVKVAEGLVNAKPLVKDLPQLKDHLQTHRRFFGNLKRCQQALEKLERDLDSPTREAHQVLQLTYSVGLVENAIKAIML
jgi:nesprin-1